MHFSRFHLTAKKQKRQAQAKQRRQAAIEEGLKLVALLKKIERDKDAARRDKAEKVRRDRDRAQSDPGGPARWAAAKALALSRGHTEPTRADLTDALNGVRSGRPVKKPRT